MLKKKVLRMFAALLGAVMLLTAAGTGAVFADGETLDGKVITYSFTASSGKMSWFDSENISLRGNNGYEVDKWYNLKNGENTMTFSFDGSKSITENGVTYDMNGTPKEIFLRLCYWGYASVKMSYAVSDNKTDWTVYKETVTGTGLSNSGRNPSWAAYTDYTLTIPAEYTDENSETRNVKFVKVITASTIPSGGEAAIYSPKITYEALRRGFDVENSTAVYPSTNDLKLGFDMALSANAAEIASYTVADSSGNTVEVAAVSLSDANVASLTLLNALKPYTEYTVTVSDDVKTAQGNELTVKSAKFSTLAKDFSQNKKYYIETAKEKWFDGGSIAAETSTFYGRGYYLGWNASFAFLFNGSYSVTSGEDTYSVQGIPTRVKFVLSQYNNSLTPVCNAANVSFYDSDNKLIKKEALLKYATGDWQNVDGKTWLIQNRWTGLDGQQDCAYKIFDIKEENIPRNTVKIGVSYSANYDVRLTNVQAVWNTTDIDGGNILQLNGEVPASNTLSVKYDAKIDAASVNAGDMVVFENGSAPITVSAASVSGDTAVLTLASALKPYTKYMLQMPALKSVEGWNIAAFTKDFTTGSEYRTVTFTDTNPSNEWLQLWSAASTKAVDTTWGGWYSAQSNEAKITIPFDGNHFKKQEGKRYKLDGVVDSIKCVIAGHTYYNASNVEIFVSENGEDWASIGKADKYKSSGETVTGVGGFLSQQWIMLDKSALGTGTKYVRFNLGKNNGILKPTVTYTAPVEKYEINDVAYTANGDGTTTAAGKVYFNFDGDKETAAFTVITAAYDNGVLSDVKADTFTDVAKGSAADFSQTVKAGDTTSIRTYVFESAASLKPIADMYR